MASSHNPSFRVEALEQRILLSAVPMDGSMADAQEDEVDASVLLMEEHDEGSLAGTGEVGNSLAEDGYGEGSDESLFAGATPLNDGADSTQNSATSSEEADHQPVQNDAGEDANAGDNVADPAAANSSTPSPSSDASGLSEAAAGSEEDAQIAGDSAATFNLTDIENTSGQPTAAVPEEHAMLEQLEATLTLGQGPPEDGSNTLDESNALNDSDLEQNSISQASDEDQLPVFLLEHIHPDSDSLSPEDTPVLTLNPSELGAVIGLGDGASGDYILTDADLEFLSAFEQVIIGGENAHHTFHIGDADAEDAELTINFSLSLISPQDGGEIYQHADLVIGEGHSLEIIGSKNSTNLSGSTSVTGDLSYNDAVILDGDVTINVGGNFTLTTAGSILGNDDGTADSLTINAGGEIYIGGDIGGSDLHDISLTTPGSILVESGVTISSRSIAAGADAISGTSTGDSGDITLKASAVEVKTGARLLSHVETGSTFSDGDLLIEAKLATLSELIRLLDDSSEADIVLDGVAIHAGNVKITSIADDSNLVDGAGKAIEDQVIDRITDLITEGETAIPMVVMIKRAEASVSVSGASEIITSGDVSIEATAVADSTAKYINQRFSAVFGHAFASAQALVGAGVAIQSGGSVNVVAESTTTAVMTARTAKNLEGHPPAEEGVAVSFSVAHTDTRAQSLVASGATILSDENVNVYARGTAETKGKAQSGLYKDGRMGLTLGIAIADADIDATVDGVLEAPGMEVSKVFAPASAVDPAANTIDINAHGFAHNEEVVYDNGGGASLGGLEQGETYYILFDNQNRVSLARGPAIDLDNAEASGEHELSPLDLIEFDAATTVDPSTDTITFANEHGLLDGQKVSYFIADEGAIGGLSNGDDYYVVKIDDFSVQLVDAFAVQSLEATVASGTAHQLGSLTFNPLTDVDSRRDWIDFGSAHGLSTGDALVYTPGGDTVEGLYEGDTYYAIVVDSTTVRLTTEAGEAALATTPIDLVPEFSFDPSLAVDVTENTLTFDAGHGLATGDKIIYENGGETSIGGLNSGTTYYAVAVDAFTIGLAATKDATLGDEPAFIELDLSNTEGTNHSLRVGPATGTHFLLHETAGLSFDSQADVNSDVDTITFDAAHGLSTGDAVVYRSGFDTRIRGLLNNQVHYVTVVDETTIRLSLSEHEAALAEAVDLDIDGISGSNHSLTAADATEGIGVMATLKASEGISSAVKTAGQPTKTKPLNEPENKKSLFTGIKDKIKAKFGTNEKAEETSGAKSSFTGIGSIGFAYADNDVLAKIGSAAELRSESDVHIEAVTTHRLSMKLEAKIAKKDGSNKAGAVAVAFGATAINNDASVILESGASVDASRELKVFAQVNDPFAPDSIMKVIESFREIVGEFSDLDGKSFMEVAKGAGSGVGEIIAGLKALTSFQTTIFNNWVRTSAKADGAGVAGAFHVVVFNSKANVGIGENVALNQNANYRDDAQSVRIQSETIYTGLYMTGGGSGAVGGSFFVLVLNQKTETTVGAGTRIHSGVNGGTMIDARAVNFVLSIATAGGKAGQFGVAGTFAFALQNSSVRSHIAQGVEITGGALTLDAKDLSIHVNLVGSLVTGNQVGVGMSVSLNIVNREVDALLGDRSGAATGTSLVDVDGDVKVNAEADGYVFGFSVAAAKIGPEKKSPPQKGAGVEGKQSSDPHAYKDDVPGNSAVAVGPDTMKKLTEKLDQGGDTSSGDSEKQGKTGIGIAGDVAVNAVNDVVRAEIVDPGSITAENLEVTAANHTYLITASGSAAFVKSDKTSIGIAGSFSFNLVLGETRAAITDT
ncbi:MAG: LEPR-XLL domain-containing protein, partial [Opitutales bacterium]